MGPRTSNRRMSCSVCNKSFKTKSSLELHKTFHSKRKGYKCFICSKLFMSKEFLLKHRSIHKSKSDTKICSPKVHFHAKPCSIRSSKPATLKSGATTSNYNSLEIQRDEMESIWNCGICKSSYSSKSILNLHFATSKKNKKHLCPCCHKGFSCAQQFHDHVQMHQQKITVCYVCGDFIQPRQSFEKHLKAHAEVKPFSCFSCGKSFARKHDLERHKNIHKGLRSKNKRHKESLSPSVSLPTYPDESNFEDDIQQSDSEHLNDMISSNDTDANEEKLGPKKQALKKIPVRRSKRKNLKKRSFDEYLTQWISEGVNDTSESNKKIKLANDHNDSKSFPGFECEICHKLFSTLSNVKRHIHLHTNKAEICNICSKTFHSERSYKLHLKGHTTDKHTCPICKIDIKYASNFHRHMKKHSKSRPYECNACDKSFYRRDDLHVHQKSHTGQKSFCCDICGDNFSNMHNLERHKQIHKNKSKQVTCSFCNTEKRFIGNKQLWNHIESNHQENLKIKCKTCNAKFASMYRLKKHQIEHVASDDNGTGNTDHHSEDGQIRDEVKLMEGENEMYFIKNLAKTELQDQDHTENVALPEKEDSDTDFFSCDTCNENFKSKQLLQRHQRIVHADGNAKKYKCEMCSKRFSFLDSLVRHLDLAHIGVSKVCPICSDEDISELSVHMNLKHPGEHDFKCKLCDKSFARRPDLDVHHRSHTGEKPFVCRTCNSSFSSSSNLRRHEQLHSKSEKDFVCHVCGKSYNCKNYLQTHIKRVHDMDKKEVHLCDICSKEFTNLPNLKRHQQIHTGSKPHICETCGKSFRRTDDLKVHKRVHATTPLYRCEICEKGYTQPQNLKKHALTHETKPKFVCELCGKSFKQKKAYQRHQNTHSDGDIYHRCNFCAKAFVSNSRLHQHVKKKHITDEVTPQTMVITKNKNEQKQITFSSKKKESTSLPQEVKPCIPSVALEHIVHIEHKQQRVTGASNSQNDVNDPNEIVIYLPDVDSYKSGGKFTCTVCPSEYTESSEFILHLVEHFANTYTV